MSFLEIGGKEAVPIGGAGIGLALVANRLHKTQSVLIPHRCHACEIA